MNIDYELDSIIKKFSIEPVFTELKILWEMESFVKKIIKENKDACFILNNSYDVSEIIIKHKLENVIQFILEENIEILNNLVKNSKYKKVVILSYGDFEILKKTCDDNNIECLSLYDCLIENGFNVKRTYYEMSDIIRDPYHEISIFLERLDQCFMEEDLIRLIYKYLEIRDFKNAFDKMEEYIGLNLKYADDFQVMKEDIKKLLSDIKAEFRKKKDDAIVMCWVDAVQYNEMEEFPFLYSMRDESLCFDNSYTVMPYTIPTFWTIFCKNKPVEDEFHNYSKGLITEANSSILQSLKENNYQFLFVGQENNVFEFEKNNYLNKKYMKANLEDSIEQYQEIMKMSTTDNKEDICTMVFWKGIKKLLFEGNKFVLLYTVVETHTPYIAGNIKKDYVNSEFFPKVSQIPEARAYIDEQLKFYWDIWKEYATTIFMSDHGKVVKGTKRKIYRDIFHTMLMVNGNKIMNRHINEMFSLLDFSEVINYCINTKNDSFTLRQYVPLENLDAYGKIVLSYMCSKENVNIAKNNVLGYRGIRTKDSVYLVRNDGKKLCYKFPCIQNLYGYTESKDLEEMYNEYYIEPIIDIWKEPFFKNSRIIYKALNRHDNRMLKLQEHAEKLLIKLFQEFSEEDVVALRGGGQSSIEIINSISHIKQVSYIIDNNLSDEEGWPGCRYITSEQIEGKGISVIIITSYDFRKEMYNELMKYKSRIRVIDLNDYFEKKGLVLREDYHADKIATLDLCDV